MLVWLDVFTLLVVFGAGMTTGLFIARRIDHRRWSAAEWVILANWICAALSVAAWAARGGLQ